MTSYRIVFRRSAEKELRRLPKKAVARVMEHIERLIEDPRPRQSVKLTGAEYLYRLRVGDYRIIYTVEAEKGQITIQYVRHRRDAYRDL